MGQFIFVIILLLAAFVGGTSFATMRYTGDWSPLPLISEESAEAACGEFSEEEVKEKVDAAVAEAVAAAEEAAAEAAAEAEAALEAVEAELSEEEEGDDTEN